MTAVETTVRLTGSGVPPGPSGPPLLEPRGPRVVLGGADPLLGPVAPSATSLFGPRGARLWPGGALVVADTGNHRVLVWRRAPEVDGAPADLVLGQPGFEREGRNALGDVAATTLNVPTGVSPWPDDDGGGLVVADTWNNRVLIWHELPRRSGVGADLVLGQADFTGGQPNRGGEVDADTLHWPTQAIVIGRALLVCDVGNRRVLIWGELPTRSGQPADLVLGQRDLRERSDHAGDTPDARGLRWPHDLCLWGDELVVADAGDNRLLRFAGVPTHDHAAALGVLGQADFFGVDHNRTLYWPTAATLNMPYGLDARGELLLCADTANSRLVGYERGALAAGAATRLTAQPHYCAKGDNRWRDAERDSVCWPYGLKLGGPGRGTAVVADTGNHRVALWTLADEEAR